MNKKWLLSLSLAVFVLVLAACSDEGESAKNTDEETETQEEESAGEGATKQEAAKPDLEGVPDVVAEVNGEEIPKEEFEKTYKGQFQQAAMQSQMSGQEVDQNKLKKQVAEGLVGQKLLIQEAENRDLNASEEAVNETLDGLVKQNGMKSKDEFISALEKQGMGEKEVMAQLEMQVKVNQLITNEYGDMEPTEKELQETYDQMKAQQEKMGGEQKIPAFDEIKPDLAKRVKSQNKAEASQKLVQELRKDADVTVNL